MFGQPVVIVLATAHKLFVGKMKLCTQETFLEDVLRVRVPTGGSGIYVQNSPKVTRFNLYGIL